MNTAKVDLHLRLDAALHASMQRLATEGQRSLNAAINVAIREYIDQRKLTTPKRQRPTRRRQ